MWFLRRHLTASVWLDLRCLRCIWRAQQCCSSAWTRRTLSKYLKTTLYLQQKHHWDTDLTLTSLHTTDTRIPSLLPKAGRLDEWWEQHIYAVNYTAEKMKWISVIQRNNSLSKRACHKGIRRSMREDIQCPYWSCSHSHLTPHTYHTGMYIHTY